jgi:beta-N-acetylhexosaminidase
MSMRRIAWVRVAVLLCLVAVWSAPVFQTAGAQSNAEAQAAALLARLTPEEKVGQLFLVTFEGSNLKPESPILGLITRRHIGGVVLQSGKDNFLAGDSALEQAAGLVASLQTAEWDDSQQSSGARHYIPVFIGMSQEGDLAPYDQLFNGMTALPSQMALGATWNINLAERSGEVLGLSLIHI